MELKEFFDVIRAEIQETVADKLQQGEEYPYAEVEFVDRFVEHMKESGMTFPDSQICTHQGKLGRTTIKISGYAFSEEADQLDLFVANYRGAEELEEISKKELLASVNQCFQFLGGSVQGKLSEVLERSSDAHVLACLLRDSFSSIEQIRIYVITDRISKTKNFEQKTINGKTVKLEVMDIERLYHHTVAGKPRDEIVVDMKSVCGANLPCFYVPKGEADYAYALTAFPGKALYHLYDEYGDRLLEANVRSYLSARRKINKGIQDTLRDDPGHFMAYNNGLVVVVDRMILENVENGYIGISSLSGLQIVNGGQTTASLFFAKKKYPNTQLEKVFVPVKIISLENDNVQKKEFDDEEEELISRISRYANSQNAIKSDDLTANRSFHRTIERIVSSLYCPDGISQWFYERAAGSYEVLLAREGTTPARLKALKKKIPSSRKISKTDLAKYYNAWACKPEIVAKGAQKNYLSFMGDIGNLEEKEGFVPDLQWVKECIAKAILFKNTDRIVHSMKTSSKISVTTHLVSLLANQLKENNITINFEKIWQLQDLSPQLKSLLEQWAPEVYRTMLIGGKDKLLSEWAKNQKCWNDVLKGHYKMPDGPVPEFKTTA